MDDKQQKMHKAFADQQVNLANKIAEETDADTKTRLQLFQAFSKIFAEQVEAGMTPGTFLQNCLVPANAATLAFIMRLTNCTTDEGVAAIVGLCREQMEKGVESFFHTMVEREKKHEGDPDTPAAAE